MRGCCDNHLVMISYCSGSQRCDSFFVYCLSDQRGGCVFDTERTSEANSNDRPLNFSQNSVLGLENPIVVSGTMDSYTVSVIKNQLASHLYVLRAFLNLNCSKLSYA